MLRGPNYWSIRRPNLIQMELDLEEVEQRPTNKIEGFRERIEQLLPTMMEHRCSEGHRGGFFKRVEEGTWMGHVIEHIALEIQTLSGMYCGFGRTRSTGEKEGVYYVTFDYIEEEAGIYTAKASVRIAQALIDGRPYDLEADIQTLRKIREATRLSSSISAIVEEATHRNILYIRLNKHSSVQLGYGVHQKRIHEHTLSTTPGITVDQLFPQGSDGRIPIIAITGTNGKTTTTRITAHIVRTAGKKLGYTTSDGIYIQDQLMMSGDCTGLISAQFVLKDPSVDFAVLECARGGILRGGLGFQQCNVAIVTNIAADHLGMEGINTVEQMARVKQVVPETVCDQGYAILNADDDLVYSMQENLRCKIALFSMDENNLRIKDHCEKGGRAAVFENGYITVMTGKRKVRVMPVNDIPITYGGKARHNIANVLPAVLSTYLFKDISIENIRQALQTFIPSSTQTPGRLNFFELKHCTFLADYAHNPQGLQLLCDFIDQLDYPHRIGIITGTGDRRDEDIRELGVIAANYFDEIIIRLDKNLQGRKGEEIINLLKEGIRAADDTVPILAIQEEEQSVLYTYEHCPDGSLITIMCDQVATTLDIIKRIKAKEDETFTKGKLPDLSVINS